MPGRVEATLFAAVGEAGAVLTDGLNRPLLSVRVGKGMVVRASGSVNALVARDPLACMYGVGCSTGTSCSCTADPPEVRRATGLADCAGLYLVRGLRYQLCLPSPRAQASSPLST
jgi:hypothetical protein